jgi:uncharacterized protein YprB with RNaseH-like and TPR domain
LKIQRTEIFIFQFSIFNFESSLFTFMTNAIEDKLSRLAALRPARLPDFLAGAPKHTNSEPLIRLLDGENALNRFGSHIRVRRRLPQPRAGEMDSGALRLLAPDAVDTVCDCAKWIFLDTETTGLAGGTGTYAFLVGLAWWDEDGFVVEQHFMRDHSEEPSLLLDIAERFAHGRVLVTFNGKSFDWPLLQTRFQISRVAGIPEPVAHLDLLHPARQLWRLSLRSVALAQLEQHVLQFDRGQDIASETIPQRYFDFLRGGPPEAIAEVFLHNQMDLCGLSLLALHINEILADPENNACCAGELFGISRLLQRRGQDHLAGRIYRKALGSGLPKTAEQVANRELALLAKRGGNYELSNALWEKLLDDSPAGLKAYEQLAIYYEHRADLPEKAAELSREALVKLQDAFHFGRIPSSQYQQWHASFHHRLNRLRTKTAKA